MDPRFVLSLLSAAGGFLVVSGGLYLIAKQKNVTDAAGSTIEVDIPLFGRIKTNYPSAVALVLGAGLIWYPLSTWPKATETLPVRGKITFKGGPPAETATVIAGTVAVPGADGTYTVQVPSGPWSYAAAAYYRDASSRLCEVRGFTMAEDGGTFNAELEDGK